MPGRFSTIFATIFPDTSTSGTTPLVFQASHDVAIPPGLPSSPHTGIPPPPLSQPIHSSLDPPCTIVDDGTTEPHTVSTTTTTLSAPDPPRPITTLPTQPTIPPQPIIPITPQVNRPRDRSPHDSHSEHSHHDERARPHSSRFDDPSDRYPPRRQYSRDRAYPSYYDRQYSPPRERTSTHQPRPRPSRFDHSTLTTSHRRHRDNSPPSRNVRSASSSYTELLSPPTASNTIPVVPSLSLPSSTSPTQPTNPPIPPSQSTHTTSSISPTQATPLPPMTPHPVTGSTAVHPELPSTYVQEVTCGLLREAVSMTFPHRTHSIIPSICTLTHTTSARNFHKKPSISFTSSHMPTYQHSNATTQTTPRIQHTFFPFVAASPAA